MMGNTLFELETFWLIFGVRDGDGKQLGKGIRDQKECKQLTALNQSPCEIPF